MLTGLYTQDSVDNIVNLFNLHNYLDIDFFAWLVWLLWPVVITIVLPIIIIILLYVSACIVHIYRLRHYFNVKDLLTNNESAYDKARVAISLLWECHGWIWHGYELVGLENIPVKGPALVVYYHGAIPVDYYYMNSRVWLIKKRLMRSIAAEFLFKTPGLRLLMHVIKAMPGTVDHVAELLQEGEIVSVAPGGIRESQFSDEQYGLVWNGRLGFAKAACKGRAPIIPVFTKNIREAYRTFPFFKEAFRWFYEKTKIPLLVPYGGFPVKLVTYIGEPIPYDPNATLEEVSEKVASAIKSLILKHQTLPGSIVSALLQRLK